MDLPFSVKKQRTWDVFFNGAGRIVHMLTTSHDTILQTDEFLLNVFRLIYHHH